MCDNNSLLSNTSCISYTLVTDYISRNTLQKVILSCLPGILVTASVLRAVTALILSGGPSTQAAWGAPSVTRARNPRRARMSLCSSSQLSSNSSAGATRTRSRPRSRWRNISGRSISRSTVVGSVCTGRTRLMSLSLREYLITSRGKSGCSTLGL